MCSKYLKFKRNFHVRCSLGDPFGDLPGGPTSTHKFLQILGFLFCPLYYDSMCYFVRLIDGLAERSKAVASGAIPKGREEALMLLALVQIPQPSIVLGLLSVRAPVLLMFYSRGRK
jgi:hypothetical protein